MRPQRSFAIIAFRLIFALTSTHAAAAELPGAAIAAPSSECAAPPIRSMVSHTPVLTTGEACPTEASVAPALTRL